MLWKLSFLSLACCGMFATNLTVAGERRAGRQSLARRSPTTARAPPRRPS